MDICVLDAGLGRVVEVAERDEEWGDGAEAQLASRPLGELLEGADARLSPRLGERLVEMDPVLRAEPAAEARNEFAGDQPIVEDVEVALGGKATHSLPVGAHTAGHDPLPRLCAEPDVAAGDLDACRHALDVPFPRPGQSLVEVVRTEDEPAVRGGEAAEVGDVSVAAGLHGDPRVRRRRQVGGHHRRRTAIEGERRDEHPPVPDRDELRHARSRLSDEDRDRVGPVQRRRPVAMGRAGCDLPRRSAPFGGLARLQCRVRRGGRHGPTVGDDRPGPRAGLAPNNAGGGDSRPTAGSVYVEPASLGRVRRERLKL